MADLNQASFDHRCKICTLGALLVKRAAAFKGVAAKNLVDTSSHAFDGSWARGPVPDRNLVVAKLERQHKPKHFAARHVLELLANHAEQEFLPVFGGVRLRELDRPATAVLAGVILPQGLHTLNELEPSATYKLTKWRKVPIGITEGRLKCD